MAAEDSRGFSKTDLVMFNPQQANFQTKVNLVPRDSAPGGLQLVNPDQSGKKSQTDLVELAEQIQKADEFTRATAGAKLTIIADQVRFLQEQAMKVLEEARLSKLINETSCNFKKIPGRTYYIYKQRKNPDQEFISMISPQEWGASGPEFVAAYRLEHDMSWTKEADFEKKTNDQQLVNKILDIGLGQGKDGLKSGSSLTFSFLPSQYQANLALKDSAEDSTTTDIKS